MVHPKMTDTPPQTAPPRGPSHGKRVGIWLAFSLFVTLVICLIVGYWMIRRAAPILKGRVVETLSTRFASHVELDNFDVSVLRGLEASGEGLRIYPPPDVVAAGATQPLIALQHFTFHSGLLGLFAKPTRVSVVRVSGLQINIPPREMRQQAGQPSKKPRGKIAIVVDTIVCDNSRLIIGTAKPGKDPKDFELQHVELHDVGPNAPWRYDATLTNAIPRGDIHATGSFGPWQIESPGDSSVTGHYTFDHADLNTIKGLAGILSSIGDFKGQLDRIEVDGTTETPDFSLDTANHPLPLHTDFHAIVDGVTGDTYLQPVKARLRNSSFTAGGSVVNIKGKGHVINLDVDIPAGQMRDFLDLSVKTEPAILTGIIAMKTKLQILPLTKSVPQELRLNGSFSLRSIHFTNPQVQDKVDMLSLRARGHPKEAKPGAEDTYSKMSGTFTLNDGRLRFGDLKYALPGAGVNLAGVYSLNGQEFDFRGKVRTEADISHLVASGWKSWLLKPIVPFFKKNGAGAEIPVRISGTKSEPKFGLDLHRKDHAAGSQ